MEVSRGTAYGLGISQCAITLGIVLFSQHINVDVFVVKEAINDTNDALQPKSITVTTIGMSMPILVASGLAACFSTVTYNMHEHGLSGLDYHQDTLDQAAMWDILFWAFSLVMHLDLVLLLANPVDLFGCISATSFMVYFLHRSCSPKGNSVSHTQENLNLVGYCVGVLQVMFQVSDSRSNSVTLILLMVIIDYFLGIGHTWDRQATIETITNCRLFYVCCGILVLDALYCILGTAPRMSLGV